MLTRLGEFSIPPSVMLNSIQHLSLAFFPLRFAPQEEHPSCLRLAFQGKIPKSTRHGGRTGKFGMALPDRKYRNTVQEKNQKQRF